MTASRNGRTAPESEAGIVVAIDVGTTKVCTIAGRRDPSLKGVDVLGYSVVPNTGLRKGVVSDMVATEKAVRQSVQDVEQETGYSVESAFVGVTGSHVTFENRRDKLAPGEHDVITAEDLNRPAEISASATEPGRKVIHAIRMAYALDGEAGIRNPLGMHSRDLEVETHLVTGRSSFLDKLVQAVRNAGVDVSGLILEPMASGLAVLTTQEKERGAVIVDIGGGTTDLVCFRRGQLCYTGVIPVGGYQFTNDIAFTFNTSQEAAEAAKLKYGGTELPAARANRVEVSLPVEGRDMDIKVKSQEISQLTRERAQELACLIKLKLYEDEGQITATRVVLTGGTSNLPGLAELMQRSLSIPVRLGEPDIRGTIPERLRDPAYATSVGILLWAVTEHVAASRDAELSSNQRNGAGRKGFLSGLLRLVRTVMPSALFAGRKGRI